MPGTAPFLLLILCLLLSGFSGLLYETIWARYLANYLGHTSYAHAIVLSVFMGGIASGSYVIGRWADRAGKGDPTLNRYVLLTAYAWIEILVGFYCGIYPNVFAALADVYVTLGAHWYSDAPWLVSILKGGLSVASMALPTFLMGGTIPILVRLTVSDRRKIGSAAGWLNASNTLGAVAGTLLAGFFLIEQYGLVLSLYFGSGANILAGLLAMGIRKSGGALQPKDPGVEEPSPPAEAFANRLRTLALTAIFLSGLASFALEVVWTRILGLAMGSSTHAFSIMLATFITGVSLGSAVIATKRAQRWNPWTLFAVTEALIAFGLLATYGLFQDLPFLFARFRLLLRPEPAAYPLYNLLVFLIAYGILFVPTLLIGMTFPLAARVVGAGTTLLGRRIGGVLFWNTSGNLIGALLAAFALIPHLGLERSVEAVIALNFGAFLLLWAGHGRSVLGVISRGQEGHLKLREGEGHAGKRAIPFPVIAVLGLLLIPAGMRLVNWTPGAFEAGLFRVRSAPANLSVSTWREQIGGASPPVYLKHDSNGSVSVHKDESGEISLRVSGKTDASAYADLPTELLSAHIPMVLAPGARDVLVIGMGSGITASSALLYPGTRVGVVEISPAVVEASMAFELHNRFVHSHPRLAIHREDAKTFINLNQRKYDIIISEPSNPWMAGVAGLFSREFFETARSRLTPGGLMVQWFHLYEMSNETLATFLATFASAFPHVTLWNPLFSDLLLIGSNAPIRLDLNYLASVFDDPVLSDDLGRVGIRRPAALLALQSLSETGFNVLRDDAIPLHSDEFPVLDFASARNFFTGSQAELLNHLDERSDRLTGSGLFLADYHREKGLKGADIEDLVRYVSGRGGFNRSLLPVLIETLERNGAPREFSSDLYRIRYYASINRFDRALAHLEEHLARDRSLLDQSAFLRLYAQSLLSELQVDVTWYGTDPPVDRLDRLAAAIEKLEGPIENLRTQFAELNDRFGLFDASRNIYLQLARAQPEGSRERGGYLALASRSAARAGRVEEAAHLARGAVELDARNHIARTVLKELHGTR